MNLAGLVEIPCPRCGAVLQVETTLTWGAERDIRFMARCACGLHVEETVNHAREVHAVAIAVMRRMVSAEGTKAMADVAVATLLEGPHG